MSDKIYITIQEVAQNFGINPTTVYRLAQHGKLPGFKIGGQWRFSQEMLEAWVADQVSHEWLKGVDPEKRLRTPAQKENGYRRQGRSSSDAKMRK